MTTLVSLFIGLISLGLFSWIFAIKNGDRRVIVAYLLGIVVLVSYAVAAATWERKNPGTIEYVFSGAAITIVSFVALMHSFFIKAFRAKDSNEQAP